MFHEFSIAETVKTAWNVLKKNFIPLVVYSAISLFIYELVDFFDMFLFVADDKLSIFIVIIIQMIIQSYLALSFYRLILTLMDKEYYEFGFKEIIPSFRMTFNFVLIAMAYALLIFILLFIDLLFSRYVAYNNSTWLDIFRGLECAFVLYLLLRSILCVCFIVDDGSSPIESLKQSFEITNNNFFKILGLFFIIIGIVVGALLPIIVLIRVSGINQDTGEYLWKLAFYVWFILAFPAVQVLIMVTYRKLVYSHLDVDDDIAETN